MMIRGGGEILIPGGDLLRMANTIIKLRALQRYHAKHGDKRHRITVVTVSMDDFISDPKLFTEMYLHFVLGRNSKLICPEKEECQIKLKKIATDFAEEYQRMKDKGSSHVTTETHTDKEKLKNALRGDPVFGRILDGIERLVSEELHKSTG